MTTHAPRPAHFRWNLGLCCALLSVVTLLCLAAVGTWRYVEFGALGLWGAVLAAAICGLGALAALVCNALFRGERAMFGLATGMLFRTILPFGGLLAVTRFGGPLVETGTIGSILIFYPVTLLVEVALVYALLRSYEAAATPAPRAAEGGGGGLSANPAPPNSLRSST